MLIAGFKKPFVKGAEKYMPANKAPDIKKG
jgi:hypothetical protein